MSETQRTKGRSRSGKRGGALRTAALVAVLAVLAGVLVFVGVRCEGPGGQDGQAQPSGIFQGLFEKRDAALEGAAAFDPDALPAYSGEAYVQVNDNVPFFTADELTLDARQDYAELDKKGRCGTAVALVGKETMPQTHRGSIGMVKPTGWQIARYDWVDGEYLYNRCHLIAFALTGQNDNPNNLITGTRSMNVNGMLPFEEQTASYIDRTRNHVLYRVTPVFEGRNLVASGVLMEAQSIEDRGAGVRFCVWCYNVEPGVVIDYANGKSSMGDPVTGALGEEASLASRRAVLGYAQTPEQEEAASESDGMAETEDAAQAASASGQTADESLAADGQDTADAAAAEGQEQVEGYIVNTNTRKFHLPDCPSAQTIAEHNRQVSTKSRQELEDEDYQPCSICNP